MRRFAARFGNLVRPSRAEREMSREIESHLALLQEDFERRGFSSEDARSAARRAYGGIEQAKELHRETRSFLWIEQLWQDARYALRSLIRTPGFTLLAILTLALGIGVNTTLFSVYSAVGLKPLPIADTDRVLRFERWFDNHSSGTIQYGFSYPEYVYCRDHSDQFSSLVAASWLVQARFSISGEAAGRDPFAGQLVSANYFSDFGVPLLMGHGFAPGEDAAPGGNPVVVLGFRFWQRALAGDGQILGKAIKLNGTSFTVIGVTREEFTGTTVDVRIPDFWAPLSMQAQLVPGQDWLNRPEQANFQIFGHLRSEVAPQRAQAQIDSLVRQFDQGFTPQQRTTAVTLARTTYFPNTDDLRFRALVAGLMMIVGLVLVVACANAGNMLLARGVTQQREIAVRLALGASRSRIIRQLLTESAMLAGAAGITGLLLSLWTTRLLGLALSGMGNLIGGDFSVVDLTPDFRVMLYLAAVSFVAGALFGLWPALQCTRPDLTTDLKTDGGFSASPARSRFRSGLIGAQVAASMFLLAVAGLLVHGLQRARIAEPGFESRSIFTVIADFGNYGTDPGKALARELGLMKRLHEVPGVAEAGVGNMPFSGTWSPPMFVSSHTGRKDGSTLASFASETYLATLGIRLIRGRNFEPREPAQSAIISETTARRFWPNEDPLGKQLTLDVDFRGTFRNFDVVGIVNDVRFANLTRVDPAHVYLPTGAIYASGFGSLLVRVQGDPQHALRGIASAVEAFDPDLVPGLMLRNLDDGAVQAQRTIAQVFSTLASILAGLALTLAAAGIYGVTAFLVSQRTRELGIRMALGAHSVAVWRAVILQSLRPVFFGSAVGLAVAGTFSIVLHQTLIFPGSMDFLYGVPFYDPPAFIGLFSFVLAVAALASAIPARRALRVDPVVALRYE